MIILYLRGYRRTICFLSPAHAQHRPNAQSFVRVFKYNIRVKSHIAKKDRKQYFRGNVISICKNIKQLQLKIIEHLE